MKTPYLILPLLVLLTACSSGYDSDVQERFVNGCMGRGATKAYCSCLLKVFESRHQQDEYAALETEMRLSGAMPEPFQATLRAGLQQCRP
ncbi:MULTISPECIES: hypothetical protein [Chromobacterium]|uniref:Lipoprotein n=1 Tax=Chromobacterium amazonense TaxID=1382803 RepID=A0A2S9X0D5_9NEIS|nr:MULTISPECIES: hypothetical protein [Chromobacterium]PRP69175.1 hypothetical protein BUE93_18545 [Chromobacterium amazonense]